MLHRALLALLIATAWACTPNSAAQDAETGTDGTADDGTGETGEPPVEPGMVRIPTGMVWRGCIDGDAECLNAELPGRWIEVSTFDIDQHEVTVAKYLECVAAAECNATPAEPECNAEHPERSDHPINCATYFNARDYCTWREKRLPTEAEWERAARGDQLSRFPWGDTTPSCTLAVIADANGNGCGTGTTAPVGSKPDGDSFFDIADMTGNVAEWTTDWYSQTYYAESPDTDPQGPEDGTTRCLRGGSFTATSDNPIHRISRRFPSPPATSYELSGFRCARTP